MADNGSVSVDCGARSGTTQSNRKAAAIGRINTVLGHCLIQGGDSTELIGFSAIATASHGEADQEQWDKLDISSLRNLADARYGSQVIFATDEWFAVGDNMLQPSEPVFDPDAFCDQGKVMDGWESRRRRTPGHDWAIVKLGLPGRVQAIEVDTAWFTGNQAPQVSVFAAEIDEAKVGDNWLARRPSLGEQGTCSTPEEIEAANGAATAAATWVELLPMVKLRPGYQGQSVHKFVVPPDASRRRFTHLRVNQHPDGGIARFRAYGVVWSDFESELKNAGVIDLAAAEHGGRGLACSNKHYGEPRNLCNPGRGVNMGDGWETARNPNRPPVMEQDPKTGFVLMPGVCDWCVLRLGAVAESIEHIVIDTNFFKGNYPESVLIESAHEPSVPPSKVLELAKDRWSVLLPRTRLRSSQEHVFKLGKELAAVGRVTHVRMSIFPDGGVMRLRLFGRAVAAMTDDQ